MSELTPEWTVGIRLGHAARESRTRSIATCWRARMTWGATRVGSDLLGSFDSVHSAGPTRCRRDPPRGFQRPNGWAWFLTLQADLEAQNFTALPQ